MSSESTVGWCAPEVQAELPGLRIVVTETRVGRTSTRSPRGVQERLAELSNRWSGGQAIALRQRPIAAAYRVFFRHIGLDPDVIRTPIEAAILQRLRDGGFRSEGLIADARLIALIDTGVPVWALDLDGLEGTLGIRAGREGESLGRSPEARRVRAGQLVVADSSGALAVLFANPPAEHRAGARSDRAILFALQVVGVPSLHVEEALWTCRTILESVG